MGDPDDFDPDDIRYWQAVAELRLRSDFMTRMSFLSTPSRSKEPK